MKSSAVVGWTGMVFLVSALSSCGGGGSNDSTPKECPVPGISLFCPETKTCCPDGHPYACQIPIIPGPGPIGCFQQPCAIGEKLVDFCSTE